jgi:2-polyprenyl-3-methyl-5-hydroxy-6-metoxy-1,4-benzoquinol methylase
MQFKKYRYLLDCAQRYFSAVRCPSCGSNECRLTDRKYVVSRLFECRQCHLYFRHPLESIASNKAFYQSEYTQNDGVTTFLPEEGGDLDAIKNKILGDPIHPKNASRIKSMLEMLYPSRPDISVVDYGASWGYISWQLESYGYRVQSYEISESRAQYGNKHLGLQIRTREENLHSGNDVFFSSHVIEHVPSVSAMLRLAAGLTRTDGFVVTLCPNGSPQYRQKDPSGFHNCWGQVHPNYLNAGFFEKYYAGQPLFLSSTPLDMNALRDWDQKSHYTGDLSGEELLVIARPHTARQ